MIERHQDYQLNLDNLPASGLNNVELQLDTDAPFAARQVKQRFTPGAQSGDWSYRFRTPRGQYKCDQFQFDTFGRGTLTYGYPLYPQLIYPAGASILVDIQNDAGTPLTNVKLLFRGSKLFPDGSIESPTYPKRASLVPFVYPVTVAGVVQSNGNANLNNQIVVQMDADFALRYATADAFALARTGTYDQLYVTLRDKWYKAYSNVPIHIDDLFGSSVSVATGSAANDRFRPGLFTPEIYLPRNHQLYFDLFRTDSAGGTVTMQFGFGGVKVFSRL